MQRSLAFFILLLACSFSQASHADLYRSWHDQCLKGEISVIDSHISKFENSLVQNPSDDLARVYLGSACALKAKHAKWPGTKLSNLNRAKSLMNKAVTGSPDNTRVRMVRAIACYKVPKRFKVRKIAIRDFEKIIPHAKSGHGLKEGERQVILYYAYLTWTEEGRSNAESLKAACLKINDKSKYAQRLKQG